MLFSLCWKHDSTFHHILADTARKKTNGTVEFIYPIQNLEYKLNNKAIDVSKNRLGLKEQHRVVDPTRQKVIVDT